MDGDALLLAVKSMGTSCALLGVDSRIFDNVFLSVTRVQLKDENEKGVTVFTVGQILRA